MTVFGAAALLTVTGCAFRGLNSLPLPGAVGRAPGAKIYHVEIANVGTLESNSPVMINDVVVGSVGKMTVHGWHADVEVSIKPDVVVPANVKATVGQTSLLGSMHLALNPPVGQAPSGRLTPGATVPLDKSSKYPSTEQTLASLSAVVNVGGLGQIGDIIHNFNAALSGHEGQIRDLLGRLDNFVGLLDEEHGDIIASIQELNRVASTFGAQRDTITRALQRIPPAVDVLVKERPRITTALEKLGTFSDTATGLVNDTQSDLVRNLQNLAPPLKALADVGPDLDKVIALLPTFPLPQDLIDRGVRGDYMNNYTVIDLTIPRLKRSLFLGTRWGQPGAQLVPAPGDPYYLNYSYDPLSVGLNPPQGDAPAPPPSAGPLSPGGAAPMPSAAGSLVGLPPTSVQLPPIWLGPLTPTASSPPRTDTPEAQLAPMDQGDH